MPRVCRMDEATCARVVDTREARLFGLPNAVYGLVWYALVAAAGGALLVEGRLPSCGAFLAASAFTVAVSAWLAWALLFRLRTPCALCFLGHGVNLAIGAALASLCW